jgi:hypothetical protein
MFNFTDAEVGLQIAHDREMNRTVRHAQSVVDRQDSEILLLRSALAKSQQALRDERAARVAVEIELEDLRRLVDEAL